MKSIFGLVLPISAVLAARPDRDGLGCHDPKPTTMMTTTPTTSSLGESCSTEVTQTFYSSSGCALSCSTGFCVIDAAVTIPCGCSSVAIRTATTTVCPTKTPCYQCYTGWGTFLVTETCSSTLPPAPAPTATNQ